MRRALLAAAVIAAALLGALVAVAAVADRPAAAPAANPSKTFSISGTADRLLAPGVTSRLNLVITNPNHQPLAVTSLIVRVTGTSAADCATQNYAVAQFSGNYPVVVPDESTRTLTQLGVASDKLPTLSMLNRPVNQDACRSVRVNLAFSGSGTGD